MAKTKFMTGDTVWYFSNIMQELRPALVNDVLEIGGRISYYNCSILNGNDKTVIPFTFINNEIYRTPEEFIRRIEHQKFEDQIKILSDALKNIETIEATKN